MFSWRGSSLQFLNALVCLQHLQDLVDSFSESLIFLSLLLVLSDGGLKLLLRMLRLILLAVQLSLGDLLFTMNCCFLRRQLHVHQVKLLEVLVILHTLLAEIHLGFVVHGDRVKHELLFLLLLLVFGLKGRDLIFLAIDYVHDKFAVFFLFFDGLFEDTVTLQGLLLSFHNLLSKLLILSHDFLTLRLLFLHANIAFPERLRCLHLQLSELHSVVL